ncbi:aminotransferase class I/II-fold pyridoxal phosphate-dependent enzyme [Nocardioides immobilis]|uniref:homocysteine desulfhydrase n=1 Tax=Nocardioides immobilis TaxID=2049295 RepID=A0A417XS57_9ACTN|nr:aminotransferase class I/II-fold pyridoxal phosphate-dependent enzyme [Nocardioides immobilis]RHW22761.1 aminotransferase class I/II-fold pyridoxal phosphate-dependent enzyme [Nocardioides immobilis]
MSAGRPARAERFMPRTRPVVPPIHQSVTYFLDDLAYKDVQEGGLDEVWYGRFRNPTVDVAAEEVRDAESAEAAFMTSSGMGAIATTLLTLLRRGDRVVAARQVYGDTRDLLVRDLPTWGFDVEQVDATDLDAWRAAVAAGPTRVVYVETLANPQLDLADLPAIAGIAHEAGAVLVVDNTFATPYNVQPLALGADVVVHSATKFLNGHSDAIAGVVAGPAELVREVQRRVITLGTCLDPHAAYLVWRGLQTFELRMSRSNETARSLAAALSARDDVVGVRHPSLPDYERAEVAQRVLRRDGDALRAGAMVSFTVDGGDERALRVMRRLEIACEATSLGGVETLVSTPFNSSHFSLTPDERRAARIDDGMIRVSCGVEPSDLLIDDFNRALDQER